MRKSILMAVALMALATLGFSREIKIAYFDSERIRNEWDDWRDAQAKFDQQVAEWQKKAQAYEDTINQLMEEYQRQQLLLSDEKKQEKEMLIAQKQQEYQEFLASVFGDNGLAAQKNAELTAPLYDKISRALSNIAERDGIDVIFDSQSSGIAYINPSLDITDELLQELKKIK